MKAAAIGLGLVLALTGYGRTQATSSDASQSAPASAQADSSTDLQAHTAQEAKADTNSEKDSSKPEHRYRIRLGGLAVGAGYRYFSGPGYPYGFDGPYGFYPYSGVYSSVLWEPFWGGFPFYPAGYFQPGDGKGVVRLTTDPKDASVYLNGGYAGTADHLKTVWLEPGAYDLSVSASNYTTYEQRIYVLSGKSLKITAKLGPSLPSEKQEKP
jgi:PEGA domain